MSVIKNFATVIGDAVGSFERVREKVKALVKKVRTKVGRITRPQWLVDMALEERWSHGDFYADEEEAQRRALVNGWWFSAIAEISGEVGGAGLNVVTQSETKRRYIREFAANRSQPRMKPAMTF